MTSLEYPVSAKHVGRIQRGVASLSIDQGLLLPPPVAMNPRAEGGYTLTRRENAMVVYANRLSDIGEEYGGATRELAEYGGDIIADYTQQETLGRLKVYADVKSFKDMKSRDASNELLKSIDSVRQNSGMLADRVRMLRGIPAIGSLPILLCFRPFHAAAHGAAQEIRQANLTQLEMDEPLERNGESFYSDVSEDEDLRMSIQQDYILDGSMGDGDARLHVVSTFEDLVVQTSADKDSKLILPGAMTQWLLTPAALEEMRESAIINE